MTIPAGQRFVSGAIVDAKGVRRRAGGISVAVEQWRPGDSGDAVIARARASLSAHPHLT